MDLARDGFIAVHVDDLIMVGSSSQLYEVVGEMKQYFTMKVLLRHSLPVPHRRQWVQGTCVTTTPLARFNHTVCGRHALRARHEECKTCGHSGHGSQR